ncbi:MAG: error-prone DNA polymerase [Rhodospirillales bacterium]|nr:error-prone DNA polymerase [Rhodospirillales bacterium]MDH3910330.1 error-prone DNA polymerase [Rhodospirillales bacterium]MDH3916808.1 error-prone DNA polymerase [Rhodospirillales bacterium]
MTAAGYAELQVTTNYSFLRGASHPDELVLAAKALGLAALGVADRNTLAGVVRAHVAAKQAGLKLLVGARLVPQDGPELLCYPRDRAAYGRLCRLLTLGKRRAEKGDCRFTLAEAVAHGEGQVLIVLPPEAPDEAFRRTLADLGVRFSGACYLAAQHLCRGDDTRRLAALAQLAEACRTPLVATNDVRMHEPGRKALLDLVTCIRAHCTIDEAGFRLEANAERHLKDPEEMARLFRRWPDAIARTLEIAERCTFTLDELKYEYPDEVAETGRTPQEELERLTWIGVRERYPGGVPDRVAATLRHELALIAELGYAPYFLTVQDLVRFARARGILCQGRGSAANSAVCYCLGITAVDPARIDLLFERFVSAERDEPPDIDVDFEHERREEVIQYIYAKYGRERAGLAATVICYRARSALREAGKAMGLSADTVAALAGAVWGWSREGLSEEQVRELGLDPGERRLALALDLARVLIGFPRHLSQHVGGFVMTRGPLSELVPIENAAMEDRTVIEWDKDDLDALGILKVDVLGLGMLTCLRKGFALLKAHGGPELDLAGVPAEDPAVYDMLCRADSIGVFQVESRAQMTMLPRLKPREFYDLVIEVAIVRPGPIQGDMVHPYLRRRAGREQVSFPSEALARVLGKTLGVPLFQEQAMQIAIVAAGFTPSEADGLRRAMATFRRSGTIHTFREKLIEGMAARGYERDFAERCFRQIEGFGTYGFPESHAASFALLVYVSAWFKCHHPAVFAAALLNSQPMGFYAPAQIVRDAREHGVEVLPPDVNASDWDCTLEPGGGEPGGGGGPALRLGLRQIKGLAEADGRGVAAARGNGYPDPLVLWRKAGVRPAALEALARGDAYRSMGLDRREALWAVKGLPADPLPLFAAAGEEERGTEPAAALPEMALGEHVVDDYRSLRLSLKAHPVSFLRAGLARDGMVPAEALARLPDGKPLKVAGLVLVRQRPGSASGVIFATLEDETGVANIVVWPDIFERYRSAVLKASLLAVEGRLQREGLVIHVVARRLIDLTARLGELTEPAHDAAAPSFEPALARADEVKRPGPDPVLPGRAPSQLGRHPRNVNPLPKSRDFH